MTNEFPKFTAALGWKLSHTFVDRDLVEEFELTRANQFSARSVRIPTESHASKSEIEHRMGCKCALYSRMNSITSKVIVVPGSPFIC